MIQYEYDERTAQPQVVCRANALSSAFEVNVLKIEPHQVSNLRRSKGAADMTVNVLKYDEVAEQRIEPLDMLDYLDSMPEEEYGSLIESVLSSTSVTTLPGKGVPTRE